MAVTPHIVLLNHPWSLQGKFLHSPTETPVSAYVYQFRELNFGSWFLWLQTHEQQMLNVPWHSCFSVWWPHCLKLEHWNAHFGNVVLHVIQGKSWTGQQLQLVFIWLRQVHRCQGALILCRLFKRKVCRLLWTHFSILKPLTIKSLLISCIPVYGCPYPVFTIFLIHMSTVTMVQ